MSNEAIKNQLIGILAEQGDQELAIARSIKEQVIEFVVELTKDDDEEAQTVKRVGFALATLELDDMFD